MSDDASGTAFTTWYHHLTPRQQHFFNVAWWVGPMLFLAFGVVPIITMLGDDPFWLHEWLPSLYVIRWPLHTVVLLVGAAMTAYVVTLWWRATTAAKNATPADT